MQRAKMKAIIGRKLGMTQIFDDRGNVVGVTVVEAGPCTVTQLKTTEKDGYEAVQLGFGEAKHLAKPQEGHLKKAKAVSRILREFRNTEEAVETEVEGETPANLKVGDKVTVEAFTEGEEVNVSGISKGKGFAGTIKRHNFHRGPKTHGSHNYRAPGSIGSGYPEHVVKGRKLPGQMGHEQVTVKNLKVIKIDKENNTIAILGAVPGPKKGIVVIKG
jgi:large subunit ribosomal protein L3